MTITDPTLPPPLFVDDDIPRARLADPITSHIAADATQAGLKEAKLRILQLVARHEPIAGSHINDLYQVERITKNWKRLALDSPRKRAGELADDGYLAVLRRDIAEGNNLPEAIYGITDKGRDAIGAGS